jgi:hypothetical protein
MVIMIFWYDNVRYDECLEDSGESLNVVDGGLKFIMLVCHEVGGDDCHGST